MAAGVFYTITRACRRNDSNPEAYLADIIGRIADNPASRIDVLLPVEPAAINADQRRHNPGRHRSGPEGRAITGRVGSKGLPWKISGIAAARRCARTAGLK